MTLTPLALDHPALDAFLAALNAIYTNGGARLVAFSFDLDPALALVAASDDLARVGFLDTLLPMPGVAPAPGPITPPGFRRLEDPIEDALLFLLLSGGAYGSYAGLPDAAEELVMAFCDALSLDASLAVTHYVSNEPWHPWFSDVAWDATYLGIDRERHWFWLLTVTDTD